MGGAAETKAVGGNCTCRESGGMQRGGVLQNACDFCTGGTAAPLGTWWRIREGGRPVAARAIGRRWDAAHCVLGIGVNLYDMQDAFDQLEDALSARLARYNAL